MIAKTIIFVKLSENIENRNIDRKNGVFIER